MPDHASTLQVIVAVGAPLTATSLNRAGEESMPINRGALERLDWPTGETIHVIEDDTSIRYRQPSALVRVTGPEPEILRAGPIDEDLIRLIAVSGEREGGSSPPV